MQVVQTLTELYKRKLQISKSIQTKDLQIPFRNAEFFLLLKQRTLHRYSNKMKINDVLSNDAARYTGPRKKNLG